VRFIALQKNLYRIILMATLFFATALSEREARAQSTDADVASPVRANTINGQIAALDVGDARSTRHFYRFSGRQGDLIITVESENLNGGVDLFAANGLRPLTQFVLFAAGQTPSRATKSVYLRQPEELVLRVEARSPNDDAGNYRIKFDGAFEVAQGGATDGESSSELAADSSTTQPGSRSGNTRRVTSVGGRVAPDETARREEAVATKAPDATPTTPPSSEIPPPTEEPAPAAPAPVARRGTAPQRGRRRPSSRRTAPPRRSTTTRRGSAPSTARTTTPTPRTATPDAPPAQPVTSPRLIIETRDGARIERSMSGVRRVTVDNNQLVIILNNGKVERQAMTNVLRFSIEP